MKLSRIIVFIALCVTLLSGCRSSKGGGRSAYEGNAGSMTNYAVDYSNEESDAMGRDLASEAAGGWVRLIVMAAVTEMALIVPAL